MKLLVDHDIEGYAVLLWGGLIADSLPVITISDVQRLDKKSYRDRCIACLVEIALDLDNYLGTGRIFAACTIGSPPQGAPVSALRQGGAIKTVGSFRCYCP